MHQTHELIKNQTLYRYENKNRNHRKTLTKKQ